MGTPKMSNDNTLKHKGELVNKKECKRHYSVIGTFDGNKILNLDLNG